MVKGLYYKQVTYLINLCKTLGLCVDQGAPKMEDLTTLCILLGGPCKNYISRGLQPDIHKSLEQQRENLKTFPNGKSMDSNTSKWQFWLWEVLREGVPHISFDQVCLLSNSLLVSAAVRAAVAQDEKGRAFIHEFVGHWMFAEPCTANPPKLTPDLSEPFSPSQSVGSPVPVDNIVMEDEPPSPAGDNTEGLVGADSTGEDLMDLSGYDPFARKLMIEQGAGLDWANEAELMELSSPQASQVKVCTPPPPSPVVNPTPAVATIPPPPYEFIFRDGSIAFISKRHRLSNFYPCKIHIDGVTYVCNEQYYQSEKALQCDDKRMPHAYQTIMETHTARSMKTIGNEIRTNQDWEDWGAIKVMREGVFYKFTQNEDLLNYLVGTGDVKLLEATMDTKWGIGVKIEHVHTYDVDDFSPDEFEGQNTLGVILQELRKVLQTCPPAEWKQEFLG